MTNKLRILAFGVLAVATLAMAQTSNAQVKPELLAYQSGQTLGVANALANGSTSFNFGPLVGYDFSPDALMLGAFLIAHGVIPNMDVLKFMAEFTYGIGTEDVGNDVDYSTLRIAVTAMYMLALSGSPVAILPLAGLAYYKFTISTDNNFFGFSADYSDIALVLGAAIVYNQFFIRAMLGAGGSSDFGFSIGYLLGQGVFTAAR